MTDLLERERRAAFGFHTDRPTISPRVLARGRVRSLDDTILDFQAQNLRE